MTTDSFPNAPRGPKLAGPIGDRHNLADLAPRPADEAFPRDIATGNLAPSATLNARETFVEKLVPLLFATVCKPVIASREAVAVRLGDARKIAVEVFDYQHGLTMQQTPDEIARAKELDAQAKRNAEMKKRFDAEAEAHREAERVDRETRDELPKFKPSSPSVQHNSPSWWIERARFVEALNVKRAAHGLNPLTV